MTSPHKEFQKGTGALYEKPDPKNFKHEELFGVAKAPNWVSKNPDQWKKYGEPRDQYTSGSCVAQTVALLLGIENQKEEGKFYQFSARPIYARGYVKPDGGMYPSEGFKYTSQFGSPLEIQMKSQLIDEMSMRVVSDEVVGDTEVAKIFKGGPYVAIDPNNIDAICSVLDRNKGVGISIRFNGDLSPDKPDLNKRGRYGHEITLTDYCVFNGVRGLVYQNSWGSSWGFKGLGFIPLDQFTIGCDSVFYFEDRANKLGESVEVSKPKHTFTKTLKLGASNVEVAWLQMCLATISDSKGVLFPLQDVGPTGYFGGITREAVKRFQILHSLKVTGEVDKPTVNKLNEIFQ